MSLASYPTNSHFQPAAEARAAAQAYLTVADWAAGCHPFNYTFRDDAFHVSPFGCSFDREYATTLWTSIRMLSRDITISPDVIEFALHHGLRQPPPVFRFPFVAHVNILDSLFTNLAEAREFVALVQHAGREALDWIVQLCRFLEQESTRAGAALPPNHNNLLSYYQSLTWRGDSTPSNDCRAVVPFKPTPPSGPSATESPMIFSGGAGAYSPLRPAVLPYPNAPTSARSPTAAPTTAQDLRRLFRALLGQEGVPGLQGIQTPTVQQLLDQLEPQQDQQDPANEPAAPEVIEID